MPLKIWKKGDHVLASDLNGNFAQVVTVIANGVSAIPTSGGVMTGPLVLDADPVSSLQAATKQYVDAQVGAESASRTTFDNGISSALNAETAARTNADTAISAQLSAEATARFNADTVLTSQFGVVQATANAALPMSGGRMIGTLTLADASPAASQSWVAANVGSGGSGGGGTALSTAQAAQNTANAALATATNAGIAAATAGATAAQNIGRNRIQNGWMEVLQRGSGPFTTNGAYTADRWGAATTASTIAVWVTPVSGYGPCRRVLGFNQSMSDGQLIDYSHRIESYSAFDLVGQNVTVSFYGAASTSAGSLQGSIYLQYPSVADDYSAANTIGLTNVTLTTTPGRVSATFQNLPAGVAGGLLVGLRCQQVGGPGNMTFNATGAQLEVGTVATPLEARSIRHETAECERFYKRINVWNIGYSITSAGVGVAATLPVTMRAVPSLTLLRDESIGLNTISVGAISVNEIYATSTANSTGNYSLTVVVEAKADL